VLIQQTDLNVEGLATLLRALFADRPRLLRMAEARANWHAPRPHAWSLNIVCNCRSRTASGECRMNNDAMPNNISVQPGGMARVRRVHFVGIGGAGMGGIAEVLCNLGTRCRVPICAQTALRSVCNPWV